MRCAERKLNPKTTSLAVIPFRNYKRCLKIEVIRGNARSKTMGRRSVSCELEFEAIALANET